MKRIFLSLLYCTCFLLSAFAQQSDENVIIIKSTDDKGTITVKKKRLEKGQSPTEYVEELNLDNDQSKKVEIIISTTGNENPEKGENLFFFKSNDGNRIEINGDGNWQKALLDFDFDFSEMEEKFSHEHKSHHQKENKVLLGVYPDSGENGVVIDGIVVGSGADKAGLKKGDVMSALNGIQIRTTDDLHNQLSPLKAGDVVVLDVLREGQVVVISSTLTERGHPSFRKSERDPCKVFFGVYVGGYGNDAQGVGISGIIEGNGWPAEQAGLQRGDRILAIDGIPVGTHNELVTERDKHKPGDLFSFTYMRDGQVFEADARFKDCPKDETAEPVAPVTETAPIQQPEIEMPANTLDLQEFNAYPNPTFGDLNIRFQGEAVPTLVRIVDATGKLVFERNLRNFDGIFSEQVDVSNAALGTMILSITQNGKTASKPVVLVTRA